MIIKMIRNAILFYILACIMFAFIDYDWNAESDGHARLSIANQTMYMNQQQKKAYFDDLEFLTNIGKAGGSRGKLLDGKEVDDIHDLANEARKELGMPEIDFPSKSIKEHAIFFFVVPIVIIATT